jgi:hypothetical protein
MKSPIGCTKQLISVACRPEPAAEVERILEPFLAGERNPVPKSGSEQAGHLIFAAMADRSAGADRGRWISLCRQAADQIFGPDGTALPCMPFHNDMSDAVFMAGPILAATGRLAGEGRYFDAAATHLRSMRELCLRRIAGLSGRRARAQEVHVRQAGVERHLVRPPRRPPSRLLLLL